MPETQQSKALDALRNDIHTLDSKISLVAQKLRTIEKNEEIIGRTIVAHNDRIKKVEETGGGGSAQMGMGMGDDVKKELEEVKKDLKELSQKVLEMRYVLDSVNPLEFVTIDQVKDMLKERKA